LSTGSQLETVKDDVTPAAGEAKGTKGPAEGSTDKGTKVFRMRWLALDLDRSGHRRQVDKIIGSDYGTGYLR